MPCVVSVAFDERGSLVFCLGGTCHTNSRPAVVLAVHPSASWSLLLEGFSLVCVKCRDW